MKNGFLLILINNSLLCSSLGPNDTKIFLPFSFLPFLFIYSRIPISRTSKENENWFKKLGVREIEGGIKINNEVLKYCGGIVLSGAVIHIFIVTNGR